MKRVEVVLLTTVYYAHLLICQEQKRYCGQARSSNPPHIFAVADAAYQALMHQRHSQSIVISGESGAGKTESGNLLLKQLVYLGKVTVVITSILISTFDFPALEFGSGNSDYLSINITSFFPDKYKTAW